MSCHFVPPYLLRHIAASCEEGDAPAEWCRHTLEIDAGFRTRRTAEPPRPGGPAAPEAAAAWTVHTAGNTAALPGTPVRSAGQPESGDAAVDEAAYGVEGSLALFAEVYGRASYDGSGAPVSVTVHYEREYVNAFWDGTQLVFGDGDDEIFERFTRPVDVLGHEFAHAVTQHTANLAYRNQSGALNESVSDAFASCLKQRLLGQAAAEADWLIGEGLFRPGVQARGLRDMAAPGTAYDDPRLGKDPQGGHMDDYVRTTEDNGGVHLNSGIPNRAFQLAATAIGGSTWEGAGRIWYAALTGGDVGSDTGFAGFAAATIAAAGEHSEAVRAAWGTVGVEPAGTPSAPGRGAGRPASTVVEVRRSGGFLGRTTAGSVDLDGPDPRVDEVMMLITRIDLRGITGSEPQPDRYVYDFSICGDEATVPEQDLDGDLRRLADLLLR